MISILITSYKEPETIGKAIESFLNQNIKEKYELIVAAPDKETSEIIKKYKQVKYFKDQGKGKMFALHQLFKIAKGEILILSDGDVFTSKNSVNEILKAFKDKEIGCVSGRPRPINSRDNMFGYWSYLLTDAAHFERLRRVKKGKYFTCSGYLFAFRNIKDIKFPRDVPEDAYIPFLFLKRGYKLKYVEKAEVFVKYPGNFKEWLEQKKRIAKAYENYKKIKINGKKLPLMKSFSREFFYGLKYLFYPRTLKEFFWTINLFFSRFYMWGLAFVDVDIKKEKHRDFWRRVESTK